MTLTESEAKQVRDALEAAKTALLYLYHNGPDHLEGHATEAIEPVANALSLLSAKAEGEPKAPAPVGDGPPNMSREVVEAIRKTALAAGTDWVSIDAEELLCLCDAALSAPATEPKPKPEPRVKLRAVGYAKAYDTMVPVAKAAGYALALHGSMTRDLDVVAVPWVIGAADQKTLAASLTEALGWDLANGDGSPGWKPHGRLAMTIVDHETGLWVDLSIMPKAPATDEGCPECGRDIFMHTCTQDHRWLPAALSASNEGGK